MLRDFLPSSLGGRLRVTKKSVGLEFDLSPERWLEESTVQVSPDCLRYLAPLEPSLALEGSTIQAVTGHH